MVTKDDGSVEHTLKLGWACYVRRGQGQRPDVEDWLFFTTCEEFWQFVYARTGRKVKLWVIAHNVGFDFTVVNGWANLTNDGYHLKFFYASGITNIISVAKPGSSIVFLDSMNWFPEALSKLGERIGIKKIDIDFDKCSESELSAYCKNDVRILVAAIGEFIAFLASHHISRLCYTRGSTAMAAYLFRHYHTPIYIHNNREAIVLERSAYKGGRVECFQLGVLTDGPYTVVDVNSLYPFVMREYEYPCKYIRQQRQASVTDLQDYLSEYAVVATVVLQTKDPVYAVRGERTIFPIGRFLATLSSPELLHAANAGHIEKVLHVVLYERANLFRTYVDSFYQQRLQFKADGNKQYDTLCKYLLNSLYGKFGQKAEEWTKIADCPGEPDRYEYVIYADRPGVTNIRYLMGQRFELTRFGESYDSFPAIAAHVTAYGRLRLWELMQRAGKGNYFYCDTDSLIVNAKGLKRLKRELDDRSLGKLKVEETMDTLTIFGLKDYITASKTVTKGIRKNAVKLGDGVYKQDRWPSIQGMLRAGTGGVYTVTQTVKHLTRNYEKGIVNDDGSIVPFDLSLD